MDTEWNIHENVSFAEHHFEFLNSSHHWIALVDSMHIRNTHHPCKQLTVFIWYRNNSLYTSFCMLALNHDLTALLMILQYWWLFKQVLKHDPCFCLILGWPRLWLVNKHMRRVYCDFFRSYRTGTVINTRACNILQHKGTGRHLGTVARMTHQFISTTGVQMIELLMRCNIEYDWRRLGIGYIFFRNYMINKFANILSSIYIHIHIHIYIYHIYIIYIYKSFRILKGYLFGFCSQFDT